MKEYDDIEFMTDSPEEIREREQKEEIRRIARTEYRRMASGEADEDVAEDIRREEEQRAAEEERGRKSRKPRWLIAVRLFLTGEILIKDEVAKFYNYVSYIALMFFLSIVTLFAALRLEMRCNELEHEVELLHERSIRIKEQRYRHCSHSAIVERLERRGIELYDPLSPSNVIK